MTTTADKIKVMQAYEDGADIQVYVELKNAGVVIHVREVIPQMEQDAKRYRRYKELAKSQARNWYLRPDKWDEEIDKTMEE